MSVQTINDGGSFRKNPSDEQVIRWKWSDTLDTGVTISTSSWTVTTLRTGESAGTVLTTDNDTILSASPYGSQHTRVQLFDGAIGAVYRLSNLIVTNESPAQTFERSVQVIVEQL